MYTRACQTTNGANFCSPFYHRFVWGWVNVFDKTVTCKFNVCWLHLRHRFLRVRGWMQMHATGHVVVEIYSRALRRWLLVTLNRQLNSIKLALNVFICICWIKMHSDEVAKSTNAGLQSAWWILLIQITIWVFPHQCFYLSLQPFFSVLNASNLFFLVLPLLPYCHEIEWQRSMQVYWNRYIAAFRLLSVDARFCSFWFGFYCCAAHRCRIVHY